MLVLAGHARAFAILPFSSHPPGELGAAAQAFFLATGLGHLAVIAFFALSGFLVGGKVIADFQSGRFAWPAYLLRRLTRLWIVIVPAIALTLLFDSLGMGLIGTAGYDGSYQGIFNSGPLLGVGVDLGWTTAVGNLAFLQTITVPVYGSNGPMWSLANEFWYYVVMPIPLWLALSGASTARRLLVVAALAGLLLWLPSSLWWGGVVWVLGALAGWGSSRHAAAPIFGNRWVQSVVFLSLPLLFVVGKAVPGAWSEVAFGALVAAALPFMAHAPSPGGVYTKIARAGSEISYTLYLTHFPLIMLLVMATSGPSRAAFGYAGLGFFIVLTTVAIAWAVVLWWLFERNTDRCYRWLMSALGSAHTKKTHA